MGEIPFNQEAFDKLSPAEQKEVRSLLAAVSGSLEQNPLAAYVPHVKQVAFHAATTPIKAFIGGNRSGKSHAGVCDDLIQALDEDLIPDHLRKFKHWQPPFYCRIITPDLIETMPVIHEKLRRLTPPAAFQGGSFDQAYNKQKRRLHFKNGSWMSFMTYEMDVDKFGGADLHRVHYDEEPSGPNGEAIRKESRMRLIDYGGDELFTFTPLFGLSWVYDQIWERRNEDNITVVQVDMDDNPHLSEAGKAQALQDLTEEEVRARKSGEFVHFEGVFYPEFSDAAHVRPRPTKEEVQGWEVVVGIDPGRHTGVTWTGFDGDNNAFTFDEYYPKDALVPEIAVEIHARNKGWGITTPSFVIDPAARIKSGPNSEQFTTAYIREGIFCVEGQNARGPGITEVKRRLQNQVKASRGEQAGATLTISEDCHWLQWEFGRYRRDPNSTDEWAAVKVSDHLLDSQRYGLLSKTWHVPGVTPHRHDNWNWQPGQAPPAEWLETDNTPSPPLGSMT